MRFVTRAFAAFLLLSLSVLVAPAMAFADYSVTADGESVKQNFGDISETNNDVYALMVKAVNAFTAEVTAGSVSSSGNLTTVLVTTANNDNDGGTAIVQTGDISNTGTGGGLTAAAGKNGTTSVAVNGDVRSVKQPGVQVNAGGVHTSTNANAKVTISGNVSSEKSFGASIVNGSYAENASLSLIVGGDVASSTGSGLFVDNLSSASKTDVLVAGTIRGQNGVVVSGKNGASSLTVWKIEAASGNLVNVNDDSFAKSINYIVKCGSGVKALKADGSALATSHDLPVAKEGERILIKAADGKKVVKAYNDSEAIVPDASGSFYYTVKRGGGIDLSVQTGDAGEPATEYQAVQTGDTEEPATEYQAAGDQAPSQVAAPDPITIAKVPASVKAKASKSKVTVTWKAIKKTKKTKKLLAQIKSVQVQCSTDPTFASDVIAKKVGKKKTKLTLKLKKKTTYYVRVRYVGSDGYSNWSKVKKVKTK